VIDLCSINTHAGLSDAVIAVCNTRRHSNLLEMSSFVMKEEIAGSVAGHKNVRPTIPVQVDDANPQGR
jgi:hypothetical protein